MKIVLISTYELGRQPFGLASPAAWLRARGHEVTCADLSVGALPAAEVREAELVAFYLPMHTATRLAVPVVERVRSLNSSAGLCAYGLYAPLNADYLQSLGIHHVIGGEFEAALVEVAEGTGANDTVVPLERLSFVKPDRTRLPVLSRYPKLVRNGTRQISGYTEASRGCKHLCRHCPVVPVYNGVFRVVPPEVVLDDIRQQVAAGAQHITFGDPDFFNGPGHARRIVESLHREFPEVTYDVTIKVEHLLQQRDSLRFLRDTGCLFVTSAVESVNDEVLRKLEKGHTRADFVEAAGALRDAGVHLAPTFIPFTPWTTIDDYADLLTTIRDLELLENVAPVQLSLRLLIPSGSRLLELEEIRSVTTDFSAESLAWKWRHAQSAVDDLARDVLGIVHDGARKNLSRSAIFHRIEARVQGRDLPDNFELLPRTVIPYMEEPWYC